MTERKDLVLTIDPRAVDTIADIGNHAAAVAHVWAELDPDRARQALASATRELAGLFSKFFGDTGRIYRDGELSLLVITRIEIGLVFHGNWNVWIDHKNYKIAAPVEGDIDMSHGGKVLGRYCMGQTEKFPSTTSRYCAKPYRFDHATNGPVRTCEGHDELPASLPIPGTWSFHS